MKMKATDRNPLVSIIVPVYNGEIWLSLCIDSLTKQTYQNLDIILVDDGSVDKTESICKALAEKDNRINYIRKSNAGVSAARNTGLSHVKGEYVGFLDADDYLEEHIIERAVREITNSGSELAMWNVTFMEGDTQKPQQAIFMDEMSVDEFRWNLIYGYRGKFDLGYFSRAVWGKLIRSDIIREHKICFREDLYIGEDAVFLLDYSRFMKKISVINEYGYYYRRIQTSATKRYKRDLLEQSRRQLLAIEQLVNNWKENADCYEDAVSIFAVLNVHMLIENGNKKSKRSGETKYQDALIWIKENRALLKKKVQLPIPGKLLQLECKTIRFLPAVPACIWIDLCCFMKRHKE